MEEQFSQLWYRTSEKQQWCSVCCSFPRSETRKQPKLQLKMVDGIDERLLTPVSCDANVALVS